MRRAVWVRNSLYQARIREHHTQIWELSGLGKIMKLLPDKKPDESEMEYEDRCLKQVKAIKKHGDDINHLTLVVRGTVMSQDPIIQKETIDIFTRESAEPPKLTQRVAQSLTRGHLSLYRKKQYISHLPRPFPDQLTAIADDVFRAIRDGHKTSFYIVQLNVDVLDGLDERLEARKTLKYYLKPSDDSDNCASAIAKEVTPDSKLLPMNINPMAATAQMVMHLAQHFNRGNLYDRIMANVLESGIARSLEVVAKDEHLFKAKDVLSLTAIHQVTKDGKSEKNDDEISDIIPKGPK